MPSPPLRCCFLDVFLSANILALADALAGEWTAASWANFTACLVDRGQLVRVVAHQL